MEFSPFSSFRYGRILAAHVATDFLKELVCLYADDDIDSDLLPEHPCNEPPVIHHTKYSRYYIVLAMFYFFYGISLATQNFINPAIDVFKANGIVSILIMIIPLYSSLLTLSMRLSWRSQLSSRGCIE